VREGTAGPIWMLTDTGALRHYPASWSSRKRWISPCGAFLSGTRTDRYMTELGKSVFMNRFKKCKRCVQATSRAGLGKEEA
jgi:hypothetical protein